MSASLEQAVHPDGVVGGGVVKEEFDARLLSSSGSLTLPACSKPRDASTGVKNDDSSQQHAAAYT